MRARNTLLIIVISFALLVVVSSIIEVNMIAAKAKSLQMMIRTAADMALEQAQLVDDFMGYGGRDSLDLLFPSSDGNGFVREDLFAGILGLDSKVDVNKEVIFNKLYNTQELKDLSLKLSSIRKPVKYWNVTRTGLTWYYVPTISLMGLDVLPNSPLVRGVKDAGGGYVSESLSSELMTAYGLDSHVKYTNGEEYYFTPVNLGITYFNPDLLGSLFMNNMDLLMRLKYEGNLNTEEGGSGVLRGTYSGLMRGDLSRYNPINNGEFTILRGEENPSVGTVKSYKGIRPEIEYKVIDMYDSRNDPLLIRLFGANKGGYPTKAAYLKSLDSDVINPATGMPYEKKPIVVAKITFYVDVVIPYFSVIAREMRGSFGDGDMNFIEIKPENGTGVDGTRRIAYTKFFAVTP